VTQATQLVDAGVAIVRRDLLLFLSYRARLIAQILSVFFSLTLFYYISRLVRVETFASPDAYYAFAVVGLIILQVLNSSLSTPPGSIRQELVAGTLERIVLSPFGPVAGAVATLVFPFLNALATALVMLGFASLVFGLDVQWETVPLVFPLGVLGFLAFTPFGILLIAIIIVAKQALTGTTFIVAGISLIAGLYFPVTLLPDWIEWASDVQPFTPAVELMRYALVGRPLSDPVWLDLLRLVGFSAVVLPIALAALRAAIRHSRRNGTIIEY
jgi:ABC-2 type transport system permease protein